MGTPFQLLHRAVNEVGPCGFSSPKTEAMTENAAATVKKKAG